MKETETKYTFEQKTKQRWPGRITKKQFIAFRIEICVFSESGPINAYQVAEPEFWQFGVFINTHF